LKHDKKLTKTDAASMPARRAGASFLERRGDIHASSLNGPRESEDDPCREGDRDSESKDAPIEFRPKTEILAATGE
jgi:hypothetical protein